MKVAEPLDHNDLSTCSNCIFVYLRRRQRAAAGRLLLLFGISELREVGQLEEASPIHHDASVTISS